MKLSMFKKSHFSYSTENQYPPFFRVIQTISSPLIGNKYPEPSPFTSLITLGLWKTEEDGFGMSICSQYHANLSDPVELITRIKLMKQDYLNKTLKKSKFLREPNELLMERKSSDKGPFPLYGKVDNYHFFYPERNGGDLEERLIVAIPLLKKIHIMSHPSEDGLRADDRYILSMLMSYPSKESYPIASALTQGVIHANQRWFR